MSGLAGGFMRSLSRTDDVQTFDSPFERICRWRTSKDSGVLLGVFASHFLQ